MRKALVPNWSQDPYYRSRSIREKVSVCSHFLRVSDGIRTRDRRDHNPELYQLSYAHQGHAI